jgi:hypothetical protein
VEEGGKKSIGVEAGAFGLYGGLTEYSNLLGTGMRSRFGLGLDGIMGEQLAKELLTLTLAKIPY